MAYHRYSSEHQKNICKEKRYLNGACQSRGAWFMRILISFGIDIKNKEKGTNSMCDEANDDWSFVLFVRVPQRILCSNIIISYKKTLWDKLWIVQISTIIKICRLAINNDETAKISNFGILTKIIDEWRIKKLGSIERSTDNSNLLHWWFFFVIEFKYDIVNIFTHVWWAV